jgi:hypothetical protein
MFLQPDGFRSFTSEFNVGLRSLVKEFTNDVTLRIGTLIGQAYNGLTK